MSALFMDGIKFEMAVLKSSISTSTSSEVNFSISDSSENGKFLSEIISSF